MRATSIVLRKFVQGKIYRGVVTGLNEAFVIDQATKDDFIAYSHKNAAFIKPLASGRDIRRWRVEPSGKYLLYMHHGIATTGLSAILEHLAPFRDRLERRATKQEWYELQQPQQAYVAAFEGPKIVMPDISKGLRFAFDTTGTFLGNTAYFILSDDLYLLAVLNSSPVESFYVEISSQVRGGYLRFFRQFVEQIPIPNAPIEERNAIAALAQKCLDAKGQGPQVVDWETEIDERVVRLYGLSAANLNAIRGDQGKG